MIKSQGISCRISKVNEQLQKLTSLIQNDKNLFTRTKEALEQFRQQESSEDSFNYFEIENQLARSKGYNNAKIQVVSNFSDQMQRSVQGSTAKSGLFLTSGVKDSKMEQEIEEQGGLIEGAESRTADITVKKFRPVYNPGKKKKESQQKIKQNSKLKNSKSQNKISMSTKTQSIKKSSKKAQKQVKKSSQPFQFSTQLKGVYKKMKTSQNIKTNSQNRLNQSLKMHINLKKEVNMKITDLNIQKQQCQRQAQYLKSVMKIEQQQKLQLIGQHIGRANQQSAIIIFMARLLVNFFSQFFNQKLVFTQQCTCEQLQQILHKKNYLIKYMLKLPDILRKDPTLCQQRSKRLFQQKHFIDHRIHNVHKHLLTDILYLCIQNLHNYISFLINNNVIKETKRKMLPYEFHSQRSARGPNTGNLNLNMGLISQMPHAGRQYDSDRKSRKDTNTNKQLMYQYHTGHTGITNTNNQLNHHKSVNSKPGLKRTNTQKVLSPKSKIHKTLGFRDK